MKDLVYIKDLSETTGFLYFHEYVPEMRSGDGGLRCGIPLSWKNTSALIARRLAEQIAQPCRGCYSTES